MKEFIIHSKDSIRKEDKSTVMSLRIDLELQAKYDDLAAKSGYSRNQLMCMALQYAIDNLKFIESEEESVTPQQ